MSSPQTTSTQPLTIYDLLNPLDVKSSDPGHPVTPPGSPAQQPPGPDTRSKKSGSEQRNRHSQAIAIAGLWDELLQVNPDLHEQGVTRSGCQLQPLSRNNIYEIAVDTSLKPNPWKKVHLFDLATDVIKQLHEIITIQILIYEHGNQLWEAKQLRDLVQTVGTNHFNTFWYKQMTMSSGTSHWE
ncbi:hypothetical protein P171DRAFT_525681 [Karstenula rhodostoma CBS 690.94]|uniref:Uncharacterized protein n=1 Tax=Karstenula rhodostoma CBS 690.94 TaxID=1392251 RepID=A0A9P4P8A9_9PLEO|nr:hypothetical protein P171DRAFT_525681 [Karstenula rhodostoma CBS 690.94]